MGKRSIQCSVCSVQQKGKRCRVPGGEWGRKTQGSGDSGQVTETRCRRSDASENRRYLACGGAEAVTAGAQHPIEFGIICCRIEDAFNQGAIELEAFMMRMDGRGPMPQEARARRGFGPEQATIFEPAQILIASVFAQDIHWICAAHDA